MEENSPVKVNSVPWKWLLAILFTAIVCLAVGLQLGSRSSLKKTTAQIPIPTPTEYDSPQKQDYSFNLLSDGLNIYELHWMAYPARFLEGNAYVFDENIDAKMEFRKIDRRLHKAIITKDLPYKLSSAPPEGYISIVTRPDAMHALLNQGVEGTDGQFDYLIDLRTGESISPTGLWASIKSVCSMMPIDHAQQRYMYAACGSVLNSLDLTTQKITPVRTLPAGQSFTCVAGYGNTFGYTYVDNKIKVEICTDAPPGDAGNYDIVDSLLVPIN